MYEHFNIVLLCALFLSETPIDSVCETQVAPCQGAELGLTTSCSFLLALACFLGLSIFMFFTVTKGGRVMMLPNMWSVGVGTKHFALYKKLIGHKPAA